MISVGFFLIVNFLFFLFMVVKCKQNIHCSNYVNGYFITTNCFVSISAETTKYTYHLQLLNDCWKKIHERILLPIDFQKITVIALFLLHHQINVEFKRLIYAEDKISCAII